MKCEKSFLCKEVCDKLNLRHYIVKCREYSGRIIYTHKHSVKYLSPVTLPQLLIYFVSLLVLKAVLLGHITSAKEVMFSPSAVVVFFFLYLLPATLKLWFKTRHFSGWVRIWLSVWPYPHLEGRNCLMKTSLFTIVSCLGRDAVFALASSLYWCCCWVFRGRKFFIHRKPGPSCCRLSGPVQNSLEGSGRTLCSFKLSLSFLSTVTRR